MDIQELADLLQIGSKFYVIGISMGAYPVWSCLKYIPHRHATYFNNLATVFSFSFSIMLLLSVYLLKLGKHASHILPIYCRLSGASLVVPFVNYWWPRIPANLLRESLERLQVSDQWTFRVAHYTPWLLHWWMTQKWFTALSIMAGNMGIFSPKDLETLKKLSEAPSVGQVLVLKCLILSPHHLITTQVFSFPLTNLVEVYTSYEQDLSPEYLSDLISHSCLVTISCVVFMLKYKLQEKTRQQGDHESLYRDLLAGYGKWEFDPIDLTNPFPNNEGSVHIWQGYEDRIIPYKVNRYIAEKLPWIRYHEVPDYGHLLIFERDQCEAVLKALLLG